MKFPKLRQETVKNEWTAKAHDLRQQIAGGEARIANLRSRKESASLELEELKGTRKQYLLAAYGDNDATAQTELLRLGIAVSAGEQQCGDLTTAIAQAEQQLLPIRDQLDVTEKNGLVAHVRGLIEQKVPIAKRLQALTEQFIAALKEENELACQIQTEMDALGGRPYYTRSVQSVTLNCTLAYLREQITRTAQMDIASAIHPNPHNHGLAELVEQWCESLTGQLQAPETVEHAATPAESDPVETRGQVGCSEALSLFPNTEMKC